MLLVEIGLLKATKASTYTILKTIEKPRENHRRKALPFCLLRINLKLAKQNSPQKTRKKSAWNAMVIWAAWELNAEPLHELELEELELLPPL